MADKPRLVLIEGGLDALGDPHPEALEFARRLARAQISAMLEAEPRVAPQRT